MEAWLWCTLGLVLLVSELFVPTGFILSIVGAAFITTGALLLVGLPGDPSWISWATAAVLILVLLQAFRETLLKHFSAKGVAYQEIHGERVMVIEAIAPQQSGQGELRGTRWKVRNNSEVTLESGHHYKVGSVDGLTVIILDGTKH